MTPNARTPRRLAFFGRAGTAAMAIVAAGLGFATIGTASAFAQGTRHVQAHNSAVVASHERRETPQLRRFEVLTNDPQSTDANEPTDPSPDPSANDEGSSDTSSSDVNDSADQSSVDQPSLDNVALGVSNH